MDYIDLHAHTNCSDGTYAPEALVRYAIEKKLKAIAITDHDTVNGLPEARKAAENQPIQLISGIEMSVLHMDTELHILGLFIDGSQKQLLSFLEHMNRTRVQRNVEMVQRMMEKGMDISYEEILKEAGNPDVITRAHFANALVKKGYSRTKKEAFETYISPGRPFYLHRNLPAPEEAISVIHSAGGFAVLAHPIQYKYTNRELDDTLKQLKQRGLDGIEAIYTTYKPKDEHLYRRLAEKHTLKITGGSDFHGANKPDIDLGVGFGNLKVPYSLLEQFQQ